jgi:hypothetical protein
VEAKLCVLEKPRTQCCSVWDNISRIDHVWNRVLENWLKHVSGVLIPEDFLSCSFMPPVRSNLDLMCNSADQQVVYNILGIMYASALLLPFLKCSILQLVVATERESRAVPRKGGRHVLYNGLRYRSGNKHTQPKCSVKSMTMNAEGLAWIHYEEIERFCVAGVCRITLHVRPGVYVLCDHVPDGRVPADVVQDLLVRDVHSAELHAVLQNSAGSEKSDPTDFVAF